MQAQCRLAYPQAGRGNGQERLRSQLLLSAWSRVTLLTLALLCAPVNISLAAEKKSDAANLKAAEAFANSAVVKKKSCVACHTIGKSGGTVGPILNQIANRRSEEWLRTWFKNPNSLKPGTKMPNFQFSESELDQLMGYLLKMKRDVDRDAILKEHEDPVEAGEALFEALDCYACHRIGDQGRFVGPNLTWVGLRKPPEWEAAWLKNPEAYKPGTFMPDFNLSPGEIKALTAFLHSLQGERNEQARKWESITTFILGARPSVRGQFVAERLACWSCHGENLAGGIKNPNSADHFVPAINTAYNDLTEEELKQAILQELIPQVASTDTEMPFVCPSWRSALTDDELADLLVYLESTVPEEAKWDFQ